MNRLTHCRIPVPRPVALTLFAALLFVYGTAAANPTVTLPLVPGFANGERIFYITTEASDPGLAAADGSTFVPSLAFAIAAKATAELFNVTNFSQPNVLEAVPVPAGPGNSDSRYSPLWHVNLVTWQPGTTPRTLRSMDEVSAARKAGQVVIQSTNIEVNCPVIFSPSARDGGTVTLPAV